MTLQREDGPWRWTFLLWPKRIPHDGPLRFGWVKRRLIYWDGYYGRYPKPEWQYAVDGEITPQETKS